VNPARGVLRADFILKDGIYYDDGISGCFVRVCLASRVSSDGSESSARVSHTGQHYVQAVKFHVIRIWCVLFLIIAFDPCGFVFPSLFRGFIRCSTGRLLVLSWSGSKAVASKTVFVSD